MCNIYIYWMINQSYYNWFVILGVEGVLSSGLVPTLIERVLVEDDIILKVSILYKSYIS